MQKKTRILALAVGVALATAALAAQVMAIEPIRIIMDRSRADLVVGESFYLDYSIHPGNADEDLTVTWRTSNDWIADVDKDGYVTAISPGSCTVFVSTENGRQATCTIHVVGEREQLTSNIPAWDADPSRASSRVPPEDRSRSGSSQSASSSKADNNQVELTKKLAREELLAQVRSAGDGAVTVSNYASVSTESLRAAAAENAAKIHFDTKAGKSVVGRLSITPANAGDLTGDLKTGVYAGVENTAKIQSKFDKNFSNAVTIVLCEQSDFGMPVEISVKAEGIQADTLRVYSYDSAANTYDEITVSGITKDSKGYLHFTTSTGGYLILSNGALSKA